MSSGNNNTDSTVGNKSFSSLHDGASRVNHVVNEETDTARDLTHDFMDCDLVVDLGVTTLVNDGQGSTELLTPDIRNANAAHIW